MLNDTPRARTKRRKNRPGAGRPAILPGGRDVRVYLDVESLERAARLGDGNLSAGIRAALRMATQ